MYLMPAAVPSGRMIDISSALHVTYWRADCVMFTLKHKPNHCVSFQEVRH